MLNVWWNCKKSFTLPTNTAVVAEVYCKKLGRVAKAVSRKRDKVFSLHNYARPANSRGSDIMYWPTQGIHQNWRWLLSPTIFKAGKVNDTEQLKEGITDFSSSKLQDFKESVPK